MWGYTIYYMPGDTTHEYLDCYEVDEAEGGTTIKSAVPNKGSDDCTFGMFPSKGESGGSNDVFIGIMIVVVLALLTITVIMVVAYISPKFGGGSGSGSTSSMTGGRGIGGIGGIGRVGRRR